MTSSSMRTKNELRCFCGHKTLLAVYGVDSQGQLYIHVKSYKQDRLFVELIVRAGKVDIHCRDCLRWHSIRIIQPGKPILEETPAPAEVASNP